MYIANKTNQYSTPKVSPRFSKMYVNMYTVYTTVKHSYLYRIIISYFKIKS